MAIDLEEPTSRIDNFTDYYETITTKMLGETGSQKKAIELIQSTFESLELTSEDKGKILAEIAVQTTVQFNKDATNAALELIKMEPDFDSVHGADGWQISNLPILSLAPYLASVEMFAEVGMDKLITKRNLITSYLEFILHEIDNELEGADFEILTPSNQEERGCQLSVYLHGQGRELFDRLMKNGVITDWREPNVIRLAPAPFYCSFEDMYEFGQILKELISNK